MVRGRSSWKMLAAVTVAWMAAASGVGALTNHAGIFMASAPMLRLRGGKVQNVGGGMRNTSETKRAAQDAEPTAREEKRGSNTAAAMNTGDAKEMLYQLTTQLFGPHRTGKTDYYDVLGISRNATPKEIRDGYYRAAKKWHPDKNKQDPNAEVRFKSISEAYEVLSDPEKRKIYDQHGIDGLDAASAMEKIDIGALVRALFGGGEFDDIFGDVSELPMVRAFMKQGMGMEGDEDAEKLERREKRVRRQQEQREAAEADEGVAGEEMTDLDPQESAARLRKEEEEEEEEEAQLALEKENGVCAELAKALADRLRLRALNKTSEAEFAHENLQLAQQLVAAPGGLDLLRLTSQTYRNKGKRYAARMFGLESYVARVKDFWTRVSQGSSLLMGFVRTSSMTQRAISKKERGLNSTNSTDMEEERANEKDGKEEESEEELSIDEQDMKEIAKQGLDVVWRLGLFLIQARLRRVCDAMITHEHERMLSEGNAYTNAQIKAHQRQMALALLEIGQTFKGVWEEYVAKNPSESGSPIKID
jgi:curved DNA-binding protein CbpA